MSGYVRVPGSTTGGIDWREPVDTREDLRQLDDPDGTARLVLQGTHGYIKDGPSWLPFMAAGALGTPLPAVHLGAVDRLAELVE